MELELFRHDLVQTSSSGKGTLVVRAGAALAVLRICMLLASATAPARHMHGRVPCMQVLPMGEEKKPQKVAAGDLTGVTQCFSVKKGEIQLAFKTLPSSYKVHAGGKHAKWHGVNTGTRP